MTSGSLITWKIPSFGTSIHNKTDLINSADLFDIFSKPDLKYHPYVRWWWNGNKVEAKELIRELRLLKDAGIGGVEINPVEFPTRFDGDDLAKPSLKWLSDEWIDMLKVVFNEAKSLGMTCDLIVGSGWPFGAEYLEGEERAQIVVIAIKKVRGPVDYEISKFEIFKEADPAVSSPIYRNYIVIIDKKPSYLNLGKVFGISELKINGKDCGVKWYGRRIFRIADKLVPGRNPIEIKVTTTMGNYMKSLTDNPIAQYWTNEKNKIQPLQSMGLTGPVTIY